MAKHKGILIEKAIRKSGYSIQKVAKKLSISRTTLYNKFDQKEINDDFMRKLSRTIHHDFSSEVPNLAKSYIPIAKEPEAPYTPNSTALLRCQEKYCRLLEKNNHLLTYLLQLTATDKITKASTIKNKISQFIAVMHKEAKEAAE